MCERMIQTILTDLDGVIRLWNSDSELSKAEANLGIPKGSVFAICFDDELLIPAITGQISDEAWRAEVQNRLSQKYTPEIGQAAVRAWNDVSFEIDTRVLALYRNMHPNAHLALITNATSRLEQDLALTSVLDAVDTVINSSKVGVAKPDSEIFEAALAASGAQASDAIFVDDSAVNVTAAANLGMHAHLYQSTEQLREFLKSLQ